MSVGLALVGAGAFGQFCLDAFSKMPDIEIIAICDLDKARAGQFAKLYQAQAYTSLDELLKNSDVQIVALNKPPFLHAEQGLAILNSGKHLFCEKPLALTMEDALSLVNTAQKNNVLLTVNYVMRHNPLWQLVAKFRESGIFGKLRHMDLANHAAGLALADNHWFWDTTKSGGIWIEHGVHFFDAFAMVAGSSGKIVGSQSFADRRGYINRVEALASYSDVAAHFYHGFDQNGITEQTTITITFEHAYLTLHEWIPTRLDILMTVSPESVEFSFDDNVSISQNDDGRYNISLHLADKSVVYQVCIQAGIRDLAYAIEHPNTSLAVQASDALDSLEMAAEATHKGRSVQKVIRLQFRPRIVPSLVYS